jgi:hypothetical protein
MLVYHCDDFKKRLTLNPTVDLETIEVKCQLLPTESR